MHWLSLTHPWLNLLLGLLHASSTLHNGRRSHERLGAGLWDMGHRRAAVAVDGVLQLLGPQRLLFQGLG